MVISVTLCKKFYQSYGAMTIVMSYLPQIERVFLQILNRWWYNRGVARIQVRLELTAPIYFLSNENPSEIFEFSTYAPKLNEHAKVEGPVLKDAAWRVT